MPEVRFDKKEALRLLAQSASKGKPLSFLLGLAGTPDRTVLLLDPVQSPAKLKMRLKDFPDVKRHGFGRMAVEGKTLTLMAERALPTAEADIGRLFKANGIGGWTVVFAESGEDDGYEGGDEREDATPEAEAEETAEKPAADPALTQQLIALGRRVAALPPETAGPLAALARKVARVVETVPDKAADAIAKLEREVTAAETAPRGGGPLLPVWQAARTPVEKALVALGQAVLKADPDQGKLMVKSGLLAFDAGPREALVSAIGARDGDPGGAASDALRRAVATYRAALKAAEQVEWFEDNPFGVTVSIRAPLEAALARIETEA